MGCEEKGGKEERHWGERETRIIVNQLKLETINGEEGKGTLTQIKGIPALWRLYWHS